MNVVWPLALVALTGAACGLAGLFGIAWQRALLAQHRAEADRDALWDRVHAAIDGRDDPTAQRVVDALKEPPATASSTLEETVERPLA